jgi:hypothetical protein
LRFFPGGSWGPRRTMTPDRVAPGACFAPAHPELQNIGYHPRLCDFGTKASDPIVPQKTFLSIRNQGIDRPFRNPSTRHNLVSKPGVPAITEAEITAKGREL